MGRTLDIDLRFVICIKINQKASLTACFLHSHITFTELLVIVLQLICIKADKFRYGRYALRRIYWCCVVLKQVFNVGVAPGTFDGVLHGTDDADLCFLIAFCYDFRYILCTLRHHDFNGVNEILIANGLWIDAHVV